MWQFKMLYGKFFEPFTCQIAQRYDAPARTPTIGDGSAINTLMAVYSNEFRYLHFFNPFT